MLEAHVQGPWTILGNAELTAVRAAAGNGQLIPGLEEEKIYLSSLDRQQEAAREQGHASSLLVLLVCCVFLQLNTTRGWQERPCKRRLGVAVGRHTKCFTHSLFNPHSSSRSKQSAA